MTKHRYTPSKKHYTLAEARDALKELHMVLSKHDGEYRVNFKGGREATAYYTDDIEDAVGTGRSMAKK